MLATVPRSHVQIQAYIHEELDISLGFKRCHLCMNICVFLCVHVHRFILIYICIYKYMYKFMCMHMYMYTHTHTHTNKCTHTWRALIYPFEFYVTKNIRDYVVLAQGDISLTMRKMFARVSRLNSSNSCLIPWQVRDLPGIHVMLPMYVDVWINEGKYMCLF